MTFKFNKGNSLLCNLLPLFWRRGQDNFFDSVTLPLVKPSTICILDFAHYRL